MRGKRFIVAALVVLAVLASLIGGVALYARFEYTLVADLREMFSEAPDPADPVARGALLFRTRGCAGCHRLDGAGSEATIGPPLNGIGQRLDPRQMRAAIVDPGADLAPCPDGPCRFEMPEFGTILSEAQVDALVQYLGAQ